MGDLPRRIPTGQDSEGLEHWVLPHSKPKGTLLPDMLSAFQVGTRATRDHRCPVALAKRIGLGKQEPKEGSQEPAILFLSQGGAGNIF